MISFFGKMGSGCVNIEVHVRQVTSSDGMWAVFFRDYSRR